MVLLITCFVLTFTLFQCGKKTQTPVEPSLLERENEFWGDYPELGEGIVPYTSLPVDLQYIDEIMPLGHLNPPGHPIPTEHIYWGLARMDLGDQVSGFSKPVKAPAGGVITKIVFTHWAGYPDYSIHIRHTNTFITYLNHLSEISQEILNAAGPLKEGWDGNKVYIKINAGDTIGKTSADYGQSAALDMGAYDKNTLHYIHPEKYPIPVQHAISAIDNFTEELKSQIYQKVKRTKEPRCGVFDFDIRGKLVGNWFLEGTDGWSGEEGYKNYLAFVYDAYDPQYLRVSLGEKLGGFLSRVEGNAPDFKDVDVNSGEVVYKLIGVGEGDEFLGNPLSEIVVATLLVKMVNEEKIKVEVFDGNLQNPSFTQNAKFYTR